MENVYADIRKKQHLDITVKVVSCRSGAGSRRAFEMTVEDVEGTQFTFTVWTKARTDETTTGRKDTGTDFTLHMGRYGQLAENSTGRANSKSNTKAFDRTNAAQSCSI